MPHEAELAIVLRGDLAAILRFAANKKNPDVLSEAGVLGALLSQESLVAGAGSNLHLRPEQAKMVAGGRNHHNLHKQEGRPMGAADAPGVAKQVKMVAGTCNHLYLLFRAAA